MDSRVESIPSDGPLRYPFPQTNDSSSLLTGPPGYSSVNGGFPTSLVKKKRGRPRKYVPNGVVAGGDGGGKLSPLPISASGPSASGVYSGVKLGKAEGNGGSFLSEKKKKVKISFSDTYGSMDLGDKITSGGSFTPHMVTVNPGEDVTSKIISFTKDGPRSICVISALGVISRVTLRHACSSGGTVTYEGRFEILSLSGLFTPTGEVSGVLSPESKMSIALSSPDGRIVGGQLGGLFTAAGHVQVVVASFLPNIGNSIEPKPRKQKAVVKFSTHTEPIVEHQNLNENVHESSTTRNTNSTTDPCNFQHINEHLHESSTIGNTSSTLTRNFPNFTEHEHKSSTTRNTKSTPTRIFKLENQTSASVHGWRRATTDMNVSLSEDLICLNFFRLYQLIFLEGG